ncbi:MAG TPA: response regulator transcription factor [Propionicimonas sp.]|jgi:DNA-binding NarL/FixJ family response regulator|nr:response regulator transcription factor [Propionicimonas sp.]
MIDVAVIDDHEAIRLGLAAALGAYDPRLRVVSQYATVPAFLVSGVRADVVLLDLQLADGSDPQANTEDLTSAGFLVLIYSIADNVRLLRRALAGGAAGVCRKADPIGQTAASIEAVAAGQVVLSQEVLALIEGDESYVAANLGAREREVLGLYAAGMEVPEVAVHLGIAENSVKEYLKRIRSKYTTLNRPAGSKLDLFRRAIEDGIVPPVQPRN